MCASLSLTELIEYTDWERGEWHDWLRQHGDDVLAPVSGRMVTVVFRSSAI
jgi:hypothetical protein